VCWHAERHDGVKAAAARPGGKVKQGLLLKLE
jgi:hypothetical protein